MTASEFQDDILPAYGAMLALATRLLGSRDYGADVVQDVIRGLWEKHSDLVFSGTPAAFAMRCVRNRCVDVLRHESRTVSLELSVSETLADNVDDNSELADRIVSLNRSIETLGEPRKSIIRLSMAGHSVREISGRLALTETNVRQLLSRTRRQLKDMILNSSNL